MVVNGAAHVVLVEPRTTLLELLRDSLGLTGAKQGCGHGECGACTVLVDGRPTLSCLRLAVGCEGESVVTVEGLGTAAVPHPVQRAFAEFDALQCGFCTPGQVISAVACISSGEGWSDDSVREWMSGNLCRCAAYPQIVAAVRAAAAGG